MAHTITLILCLSASISVAQDWSVTTSDFRTRPADFRSLTAAGIRAQIPGFAEPTTIALDQFVSLQRTAPAPAAHPKFTLLLNNGDRFTGEPSKKNDEQLLWQNPLLGEIPIPLNHLIALFRGGDISAPPIVSPTQDVIILANGDTVTGVITDFSPDIITLQTETGPTPVPVGTINKVVFAAPATSHPSADRAFRIKLTDSSTLTAKDASVSDNQLTFTLNTKPSKTIQLPLAQLQLIEQLNGPISWLSARIPTENIQNPYFGGAPILPARMDTTVDGFPLQFNNQHFTHGIGVHAYSKLAFPLEPGWSFFQTQYAVDSRPDHPRPMADVTLQIQLDGKTVHEESHLRAGTLSPAQKIPLGNAKTLTLIVNYGSAGDTQDQLNWIEPALIR